MTEEYEIPTDEEVEIVAAAFIPTEDMILQAPYNVGIWGKPGANKVWVHFMGKKLLWHKWAVKYLMDVQSQLLSEGWDKNYHWNDLQTYNPRRISGSSNWSQHSGPLAIDINPMQNPIHSSRHDLPSRVIAIFKAHRFTWGGDWPSIRDNMHFEINGPPVKSYTPSPAPVPTPTPDWPLGKRVLKLTKPYMHGRDVYWCQQQYNKLKTYPQHVTQHLNEDSVYGPATADCTGVFQFRHMKDDSPDKIVGPKTWVALKKATNN